MSRSFLKMARFCKHDNTCFTVLSFPDCPDLFLLFLEKGERFICLSVFLGSRVNGLDLTPPSVYLLEGLMACVGL
jgi:hypothetical protein